MLSRANDWYQHPEMADALAAIRGRAAGAARLTTYGSSMGGYAAIRFADAVGAHAALALSPQYSIDPLKAPFEWRWQQEAHRIRFLPDLDGPIRSAVTPVIVYDPTTLDRAHVDRIAADIPVARLRVPHSGHPVGPYLSEGELLTSLVLDMIRGTLDIAATEQAARARRREIITYLAALARAQPAARPRLAIRIARHAVALKPDHPLALLTLADRLRAAELLDEAIAVHRHLAAVSNRHPTYLFPFSMTLAADEQVDEALALAREVQQGVERRRRRPSLGRGPPRPQGAVAGGAGGRRGVDSASIRRTASTRRPWPASAPSSAGRSCHGSSASCAASAASSISGAGGWARAASADPP